MTEICRTESALCGTIHDVVHQAQSESTAEV
jgi:hypothetical protein